MSEEKDKYISLWSEKFGKAGESFYDFFARHGIDPTEHLNHVDEIKDLFDQIGAEFNQPDPMPGELQPARIPPFGLWHTHINANIPVSEFYKLNSYGSRCDEFKTEHDGKHVLFAGCSITAGDSMYEEFIWSKKLYDRLSKEEDLSGYFNVGVCGATFSEVIRQIFVYINTFGKPDVIFVNFPDIKRESDRGNNQREMLHIIYTEYLALSLFCKTNSIRLIAFTWDVETSDHDGADPRKYFDDFHTVTDYERFTHMHNFVKQHSGSIDKNLMLNALDYVHPGVSEHDFYATYAYNLYKEKTNG